MSDGVMRCVREDGTEHIVVRPPPAVLDIRAEMAKAEGFGADPRGHVLDAVRRLVEAGISIELTPEGRANLARACPEALELLGG